MVRFSAAIVTYFPDAKLLERALASLAAAISHARAAGMISESSVYVIDNGTEASAATVRATLAALGNRGPRAEILAGQGNIGYGAANNLVLAQLHSDVHLVMNPDVEMAPESLTEALRAMGADSRIGALAPSVQGADGERQYLCKRYPSVWVLFLRGFAPPWIRRRFGDALDRYEMRDVSPDRAYAPVPLASGCFLVVSTPLLVRLGGFDPRYFMYFEDYDLSLRIGREAQVAYVPAVRIVHHGGDASRKGPRHIAWFLRSAWRFFATHGWKIA